MEKIKEFIRVNRQSALNNFHACYTKNYTDAYKANYWDGVAEGYDKSLEIIDQELQYYTFIRVPKRVKLSEIFAYMRMKECLLEAEGYQCYIWTAYYATIIMNISKESTICNIQIDSNLNKFKFKWLYELWLAGTIIEVDA